MAFIFYETTFFDPFWRTLGVWGSKESKIVHPSKNNFTEAKNLHSEVTSHKRFDTVTRLGQITIFDTFWGTVVVENSKNYQSI